MITSCADECPNFPAIFEAALKMQFAVAKEREACAQLVEASAPQVCVCGPPPGGPHLTHCPVVVAASIRARS